MSEEAVLGGESLTERSWQPWSASFKPWWITTWTTSDRLARMRMEATLTCGPVTGAFGITWIWSCHRETRELGCGA
jgi:hypothetical protein